MAANDEVKLKIKADADQAKREIGDVKKAVANLKEQGTDKLAQSLGDMAGPAGIAAGAVAAVGTAALGAATAIWNITTAAAEYGSQIFDASQKTGLGAEALSSLKYAADTSGSSFEKITGSVQKFSVLLGQAEQGNDKANATLAKYGVTSRDTEDALTQAMRAIAGMTDENQRAIAAQELFKDRSGEVLQVIQSFNGDLPGLISKVKELGLAMSDEAAQASDEFGDALDTLRKQSADVAFEFATGLMPALTRTMEQISASMVGNENTAKSWGVVLGDVIRGIVITVVGGKSTFDQYFDALANHFNKNADDAEKWQRRVKAAALDVASTLNIWVALWRQMQVAGEDERRREQAAQGNVVVATDLANASPAPLRPLMTPPGTTSPAAKTPTNTQNISGANAGIERDWREAVQNAKRTVADTLEIYQAGYKERIAKLDQSLANGLILEKEHIREVARIRLEALQDEKRQYEQLRDRKDLVFSEQERAEVLQKIKVLEIEIRTEKIKGAAEIKEHNDKEAKADVERLKREEKKLAVAKERLSVITEELKAIERAQEREDFESGTVLGGKGLGAGIGRGLGLELPSIFGDQDEILSQAEFLKKVYEDVADFAGNAIGSMIEGLANLGAQWLITGEFSAKAALSMLASAALSIATQAGLKALMSVAEGISETAKAAAAAAVGNAAAAALHTKAAAGHYAAAAFFGKVAAVAGVAGVALGLGARAAGGGDSATGGSGGARDDRRRNTDPQSRLSDDAYMSGRRENVGAVFGEMRDTLRDLRGMVQTASPGDVLIRGARQAPGAVGNAALTDLKTGRVNGRELGRAMGMT